MIAVISCVKNEEYYLPSFLDHIRDYVDAFIFLDDGSTDKTLEILKKEAKMLEILKNPARKGIGYEEANNRVKLVKKAQKLGIDWVLCCDPDERFEIKFLKNLKSLTSNKTEIVYSLRFRELWGNYKTFRDDGIWDKKRKSILFPTSNQMTYSHKFQYHAKWFYDELDNKIKLTEYNLYHLKMIKQIEREKRRNLYNELDPKKEIQNIGYDYLVDEEGLNLKRIPFFKRYNYKFLPEDIKQYKE